MYFQNRVFCKLKFYLSDFGLSFVKGVTVGFFTARVRKFSAGGAKSYYKRAKKTIQYHALTFI